MKQILLRLINKKEMCMMKIVKGGVTKAKGFEAAGVEANIKYQGRTDMAIIFSKEPCVAAGTFTTSFRHFRSLAVREYTSAISNWQWGLTHPKAKKRQSIKFIRDIFWRQQRCWNSRKCRCMKSWVTLPEWFRQHWITWRLHYRQIFRRTWWRQLKPMCWGCTIG